MTKALRIVYESLTDNQKLDMPSLLLKASFIAFETSNSANSSASSADAISVLNGSLDEPRNIHCCVVEISSKLSRDILEKTKDAVSDADGQRDTLRLQTHVQQRK